MGGKKVIFGGAAERTVFFGLYNAPLQIWEENWGASYSPNVVYLAWCEGWGRSGGLFSEQGLFSYFPPLKPRCILWSGALYSLKNMVNNQERGLLSEETAPLQRS